MGVQAELLVLHSEASHAWSCSVPGVVRGRFGDLDEVLLAGRSSEGGAEEGCSGLPEAAAALGRSAGSHSALVASCSPTLAGWSSEAQQPVSVEQCDGAQRGWQLSAVSAEGSRV